MASFLYFLPDADHKSLVRDGRLTPEQLQAWGLRDVFADVSEVPNHCIVTKLDGGGPIDGTPGVVLVPHPANRAGQIPRVPSFDPESQTWLRIGEGGSVPFIGWQTDSPPTPEDLERREALSGYRMADHFGRSWRVPVVRGIENQYGFLPVDYEWKPESVAPGMVLRRQFDELWKDSAKVWDHLYLEGYNCPELFVAGFVARCLATNYRIGPRELEVFRRLGQPVFDRGTVDVWAAAACDYPAVTEYAAQKKMTVFQAVRSGMPSTAGEPAGTTTFNPAAESSA